MHLASPARARRGIASVAAAAGIALLLAGCQAPAGEESTTPVEGGILSYASGDAEPTCLDPHVGGNYPQALIAGQFLESLVSRDADGKIIPWLATEWSASDDGLSWEFTLRDDVSFTDGTPLDAEAVKVNVEHLKDPATESSTGYLALGKVDSVEVVSDTVARFSLSAPDSALLESLSMPWLAIESPAGIARGMEENCQAPIGTGPFIVDEWVKQDHVSLVRNDDYNSPPADAKHDGKAYLDGIEWRFIPDSASRYAALQGGQVDVLDNAQPDTIAAAEKTETLAHLDAPRPGASNRIELNAGAEPFSDPAVREAFVRAVDVNDGIESLFFGSAGRSYSPLSSVESAGYSDESLFSTDLDEANRLLDEAGWNERDADGYRVKNGERLSLDFPVSTNQSIPAEQSLFEQIQATAKDAGFEVNLSLLDLSSWYGVLAQNNYDLVSAPYTKVGPDVLRILYHSDGITPAPSGYFANLSQVNNPELDDLLTRASEISDEDERASLYEDAQSIILGGFHILPLYDQQNHFLMGTHVKDARSLPTVSTPTFYDAWLDGK
ncbi:ABC transporter substrate-binding protein [Mycetocola manganoxydans]|uniref:ABC transporter substrate-binding protein n=1 Tax=Mycetocola manganoxydans TaxID=699879 RepID=A0A3L6ZV28_9MICO|nr:ABC transporter substrate-binding protein [Mycetocola manganoxydans]RLP71679.1 ABC transporter substrate-binding protein [Mycetocola manganoxydans]GHD39009.1 peptide ABC transporter [Mycetocola manganoxydans]